MGFTDIFRPGPTPGYAATFEEIMLCYAISRNDRPRAEQILEVMNAGSIVAWNFTPADMVPSWAMSRNGQQWNVFLAGADNAFQVARFALESYTARSQVGSIKTLGIVADAFEAIWPQVRAALPPSAPAGFRLQIAGHSLGGCVAMFLADQAVKRYGANRVQLMTFGSPKCMRRQDRPTLPVDTACMVTALDGVPYVPFYNSNIATSNAQDLWQLIGSIDAETWAQQGDHFTMGFVRGSAYEGVANNKFDEGLFVTARLGIDHSMDNYAGQAEAAFERHIGAGPQLGLVPIRRALFEDSDQFGTNFNQNPSAYVDYAAVNAEFPGVSPAPVNTTNSNQVQSVAVVVSSVVPGDTTSNTQSFSANIGDFVEDGSMAASGFWKLTMFINNGTYGHSESHSYRGNTSIADAIAQGQALAQVRSNLLGNAGNNTPAGLVKGNGTPWIQYLKVSDAMNPRLAQLIGLDQSQSYFGWNTTANSAADFYSVAISNRLPGLNFVDNATTHYGVLQVVGQPDVICTAGIYNGNVVINAGKTWDFYYGVYLRYLCNPTKKLGFMGQDTTHPPLSVGPVALNVNNFWQWTQTAHGWSQGDRIRITSANNPIFNGTYKVIVVDANTLAIAPPPSTTAAPPTQMKVQRIQLANGAKVQQFYAYQPPVLGWVSPWGVSVRKHSPGREFNPVTFRRRRKRVH